MLFAGRIKPEAYKSITESKNYYHSKTGIETLNSKQELISTLYVEKINK